MVTWNNPPTREWDDLVAMLNPAYMVGQLSAEERYVALAVCHPVVALPLLRCYQEGLASGTLRESGHGRQPSSTARRRTLGTPGHGSTVTGLPAGSARLRPRTGTRGILSRLGGAL